MFPPEVVLLKSTLERLNLNNNLMLNEGIEGNAFLGDLQQLRHLYYGSTFFAYDGIPTEIGLLTNLIEYDCSYTVYYGPLQDAPFTNLTNLTYLDISGNSYNSSIPSSISNLPSLKSFYAGNSYLSGTLDFIKGMKSITEMWLDQNPGLNGTIPSAIGNLTKLTSLSVTNCSLQGTLPSEMGELTAIEQMWFYGNYLSGTVPKSIGKLTNLQTFQIETNDITGTMPAAICRDFKPPGNLTTLTADCGARNTSKIKCKCCTCCGTKCDQQRVRHRRG
jgi:Leucine-rich repeat (LRR) protein